MLFSCLPPDSKCEWAHLHQFVNLLNSTYGKDYTKTACLDRENSGHKEPEFLLEAPSETPIVVEHKAISWPPHHLHGHSHEHEFFEKIAGALRGEFSDAVYQLTVREESFSGKTKKEVQGIAKQISQAVLSDEIGAKSENGIGRVQPIPWSIRPLDPTEIDESIPNAGVGVSVLGSDHWEEPVKYLAGIEAAKIGYSEELERLAIDAGKKFEKYSKCQKVFVVQFYGDGSFYLDDEDITGIVRAPDMPDLVDEVWVAKHDWVSIDDYVVTWKQVK